MSQTPHASFHQSPPAYSKMVRSAAETGMKTSQPQRASERVRESQRMRGSRM